MNLVFFFLLGLCIGSFLNVAAYRVPEGISIVKPNSFCPECKKPVKPLHNIPVVSYLFLKGRCAECGSHIPLKYPLVELATAFLFIFCYLAFGLSAKLAGALIFSSILIAVTVVDFEKQIIPDKFIIFGLEAGFILWLATIVSKYTGAYDFNAMPLIELEPVLGSAAWWSWIGLIGGALAVYVIAVVSAAVMKVETMGGGDLKLSALAGFFTGPYVFLIIGLSFIIGALVMVPMIIIGKVKRRQAVAFGPFIAAASLLVMFFGPAIWGWYWGLM